VLKFSNVASRAVILTMHPINTKIREARVIDSPFITEFNLRMAWETEKRRLDPQRVGQGVAALLNDPAKGTYFVAEVENAGRAVIAGQLLITYEWSDWRNGNFWWIQSVYVAEEFRAAGVFKSLYQHVQTLARTRTDVCGLRLYVDAHNDKARKAYERLGLKKTDYEFFEIDFVLK
jgi:GNAT superfamily N-acetyltransferase